MEGLSRISGGASRETYRFEAVTEGARTPLILRRDPPGSLIETDRRMEFLAIQSFTGKGVFAPEALALETEGAELERPFFIMAQVLGGVAGSPFAADPFGDNASTMGQQFFATLGRIAGEPIEGLPILDVAEPIAPEDCWRRELDYWAGVVEADEQHPQPILRAAIRRLRRKAAAAPRQTGRGPRRLPHGQLPPRRLGRVAGDPRLGDGAPGRSARGPRLGDQPAVVPGRGSPDLRHAAPGRGLSRLERGQRAGDRPRGPEMVVAVRLGEGPGDLDLLGQGVGDGGMVEPILAFSGWYTARRHDEIIARQLLEWPL